MMGSVSMPARPGYYAEQAEGLLIDADEYMFGSPAHGARVARAQVYATLELASAQHLANDMEAER